MKTRILALLVANLVSLAFIALAAWIIYLGKDGWGWVVFAALLSTHSFTSNDKEKS